ncbi:calpain-1 catalytic subunit-like [Chaetodon trifascialis]|uniref:calpain-1 catalytic subunit-like n=1 Tax=Chaetodon trifascialis TaxID=109706 RepID=UPI00399531C8
MTTICVEMILSSYEDGDDGSPSNPLKFKGQDYEQIKEALLSEGGKFEDDLFPANLESLGELEDFTQERLSEVEWLRPHELNPDASFIMDGVSRFDFKQGDVGNCWFLSSIGALTFRKSLMERVVPPNQSFKDNYAGIFHFKFWRFGKWVDVVIDDLLPTRNGVPVSVSSSSGKEFWAPLMEKAYAKICGSYGDMIAGNPSEALKDFSGDVHVTYTLSKSPSDLWDIMDRAFQCRTMMGCCSFSGDKGKQIFEQLGVVDGHAFAVTKVKRVESEGTSVNLVRIWNPWGEKEWSGDWSDKSDLWTTVSEEDRDECLKVRDDGEFWIKMEDFRQYFEDMDICCNSPNFVEGDDRHWNCYVKEGRWEAGVSAGGFSNGRDDFWTNPQYRLTVEEVDGWSEGDKNILVSLMQKHDEEYRSKVSYHYIGCIIYKAPQGKLPSSVLQYVEPHHVSYLSPAREFTELHSLEPGEYVIIPCTDQAGQTADFLLTVYSKGEAKLQLSDDY